MMGMITTGANVSAGWSFRKFGSNTVFRKVAYMWGPPTRSVMRRSTPPAVVFPSEWTSGGTATRTAERERTIRSQRGFAIHGDAVGAMDSARALIQTPRAIRPSARAV